MTNILNLLRVRIILRSSLANGHLRAEALTPRDAVGGGNSMSFVFYDTETTGTNTSFDQILHFAAIRTDDDLKEIDRFEIRCSLDAHVVPSAGAFRVTGMTIGKVTAAGLPTHYEMVCQLRTQLEKWCPTTFVGWNTLSFDENLLRRRSTSACIRLT